MVIVGVRDVVPAGQFRPTAQLLGLATGAAPGTVAVQTEPLNADGLDTIPSGRKGVADAGTNNQDPPSHQDLAFAHWMVLHMVDTVRTVRALPPRLRELFPLARTGVFTRD